MSASSLLDEARSAGLEVTLSPTGEVRARALRRVPIALIERLRENTGAVALALGGSDVAALRAQREPPPLEPGAAEVFPSLGRHRIDLAPDRCWSCGGARLASQWCRRCSAAYEAAGILPRLLIAVEPWAVAKPVAPEATVTAPRDAQDIADAVGGRVVRITKPTAHAGLAAVARTPANLTPDVDDRLRAHGRREVAP